MVDALRRKQRKGIPLMRISLIVPVRNEANHIRHTLMGLVNQDLAVSEYEILVVDGMSDDESLAIVREMQRSIPNLHILHNPKKLASAARNIGVLNARGDYVAIVDGHCQIRDPQFLTKMVEAFETSGADSLGRPQPLHADEQTVFQQAVSAARTSWLGHNPDSAIYSSKARFVPPDNVAVAYRTEVFEKVGLFDEAFDACEDVEFNTRVRLAGLNCYFTPDIGVEYSPRPTMMGLAYQMTRYGRGRARLAQKLFATITLPSLVPPIWLIWLTFALLASAIWTPISWALCLSVILYVGMILAESHRLWQKDRSLPYRRLPLIFATIHASFGWGYLRELFSAAPTWPGAISKGLLARLGLRVRERA